MTTQKGRENIRQQYKRTGSDKGSYRHFFSPFSALITPVSALSLQKSWLRHVLLAFVSVFDQCLIDVLLPGVFQDVEETQVDSVRLFNDDVQQRLSGFD